MQRTLSVPSPSDAHLVSEALVPMFGRHQVFCFHGELGAGKTTYIKEICAKAGVQSGTSSPSFAIVNEYYTASDDVIYHFDLYRLKKPAELLDIGWEEYLHSDRTVLVEWPEMAEEYMPSDAVHIFIEQHEDQRRTLTIKDPL